MNAQQLKNSILQEAIEGRLVPQDPNDEPASVLLDKIRKEKAKLVKEGKLKKKDLIEIPISEDEIPFEIPMNWTWVKLGSIVDFSKSNSVKSDKIKKSDWVLDLEDIEKDTGVLMRKKTMQESDAKSDKHIFYKGNVLYSKLRPYLNKVIIADGDGYCTSEILAFDFGLIYNKYAQYYLMSPFFVSYAMSDAYGVKMPRLGSKQGNAALFPLPPLAEQKRIVAKIEELLPKVEEYGKAQEALDKLNEELPERLKKSILQEAITGRLVPQDPNDEPASVLLDKIRAEKKRLVKEGKLKKKDLEETPIEENEIPFKIPESWEWVRHNDLFDISGGSQPPKSDFSLEEKEGYIRLYQIRDYGEKPSPVYIPISKASKITQKGDILLARYGGSLGKVFIAEDGAYNVAMAKVEYLFNKSLIDHDYLYYYYNCSLYQDLVKGNNRSAQGGFNKEDLGSLLFPLPPLAEQKRIVEKIEQLMKEIDKLKV
jgi:type I restriction enzyme S subunit